jgi:signal transduction histidine kinase
VFAAARDVTERKRFEQALQESNVELKSAKSAAEKANLAKSDFLSSMSHELRSPLNAILGFAQLMESASPPPTPSQSESIAQILQAGWHLLKLINEILDLAVIESGKVSLSPESGLVVRGHVRMPGHDGAAGATARHQHDLSPVRGRSPSLSGPTGPG